MNAKEIVIDFLSFCLLVFLVLFVFFFFFLGGRYNFIRALFHLAAPLAFALLPFLIILPGVRRTVRSLRINKEEHQPAVYLETRLKRLDLLVIGVNLLFLAWWPFIFKNFQTSDAGQMFVFALIMSIWHICLFRSREEFHGRMYITYLEQQLDSVLIALMPVLIILIAVFWSDLNFIDGFQAASILAILKIWRWRLIRPLG